MKLIINGLNYQVLELTKQVDKRNNFTPPKRDLLYKGSNLEVEHIEKTKQLEDVLVRLQELTEDLTDLI